MRRILPEYEQLQQLATKELPAAILYSLCPGKNRLISFLRVILEKLFSVQPRNSCHYRRSMHLDRLEQIIGSVHIVTRSQFSQSVMQKM